MVALGGVGVEQGVWMNIGLYGPVSQHALRLGGQAGASIPADGLGTARALPDGCHHGQLSTRLGRSRVDGQEGRASITDGSRPSHGSGVVVWPTAVWG